jgi:hypothetical protein
VATGSGNSLGDALLDLAAELGGAPRKSTYTAKGWHAQISRLTATQAGYKAADRVGLDVTERTLKDWLAERREPNAANKALIAKAYTLAGAGNWPDWENKTFKIYGLVAQGDDERERGSDGIAPLIIDGTNAYASTWAAFRTEWESGGGMTDDDVEEYFSAVIVDDIGGSVPWTFPGTAYTVTA